MSVMHVQRENNAIIVARITGKGHQATFALCALFAYRGNENESARICSDIGHFPPIFMGRAHMNRYQHNSLIKYFCFHDGVPLAPLPITRAHK